MGFVDWARNTFGGGNKTAYLKECYYVAATEVYYKDLAIETCVDLIAKSLAKCEIQTFEKGKSVRKNNYYLFNVQPNQNQNATEFLHKAISKYIYETECLIVMRDEQLYIADSFNSKEFTLKPNLYMNVTSGDFTFKEVFKEHEVFHFKLSDKNILATINSLYESYGKLLASAMNYYRRKNNKRILVKGDFLRAQDDDTQKEVDALFEEQMKNWFDPEKEATVFQLQDGLEFDDMSDSQSGSQNVTDSKDIRAVIEDIINFVAMRFNIPRGLLKGDLADIEKQVDAFIAFTLAPIAEIFADEFNRKMYTKEQYLQRTYLKIDTSKVKIVDINQLATAIDKLFAVGGVTINDILEMLGREPIADEYADERYVTKNYQKAGTAVSPEGGE